MKIKNLPMKPSRGGVPANDKNNNTKYIVKNEEFPINFNSFKVLIYFKSNKNNSKNILVNINIYKIILNNSNDTV
jgi:hypothetical protein